MNPLLLRHLTVSARRKRFFWLLTLYLVGVGILVLLFSLTTIVPLLNVLGRGNNRISMMELFVQGRALYWFASFLLFLSVNLLIPSTALGAIAGERDNRTLELLRTTTLQAREIVLGKVAGSAIHGALYVLAPLPLLMTGFWLGGVSITELVLTFLFLILTMLMNLAWAMFLSSLFRKTISAVLVFYGLMIASVPLAGIVAAGSGALASAWQYNDVVTVQPLWIEALIQYNWIFLAALHPISAAAITLILGMEQGSWFLLKFDLYRHTTLAPTSYLGVVTLPSPWILYTIFTALSILFLLYLTIRRVQKPER